MSSTLYATEMASVPGWCASPLDLLTHRLPIQNSRAKLECVCKELLVQFISVLAIVRFSMAIRAERYAVVESIRQFGI
jgi:hypothetical protein